MRPEIYQRADEIGQVWEHDIMPLLEDLFYGRRDLVGQYGLNSLRKHLANRGVPLEARTLRIELILLVPASC